MKVLIFSTAYLPFIGGAEIAVSEICKRISDVQFDLITARIDPTLPKKEKVGNITVHRVGFGYKIIDKIYLALFGACKAKQLDKKNNYSVIWSIMASQGGIAAGRFKKKFKNKKLVLTLQEGDEETHLMRYAFGMKWLYKLIVKPWHMLPFKQADLITVISKDLEARARKYSEADIVIIPNGVDVKYFSQQIENEKLVKLRSELGIKEGDVMLLTISRLVKKNAVNNIISSLNDVNNNVKLIIIGSGPDKAILKTLVRENKLESRVKFLGSIEHSKLPIYIQAADIFTRPSLSEGFGNVFVEAMAAGTPVIATPVGGITDFLFDPDSDPESEPTGLFCEAGNSESLANQVRRLMFEPLLVKEIIANALAIVQERYDWSKIAESMLEVFNKK